MTLTRQSRSSVPSRPQGPWTLEITVDSEGLIWEIDETNNVWSRTVSGSSGFGAATVMLGGGGLLALVGAGVLLRRRGAGAVEEESRGRLGGDRKGRGGPAAAKPPAQLPTKRRGPPGGKVAASSRKSPSRGPPRGPPKSSQGRGRTHTTGTRSECTWPPLEPWNRRCFYSRNGWKITPNSRWWRVRIHGGSNLLCRTNRWPMDIERRQPSPKSPMRNDAYLHEDIPLLHPMGEDVDDVRRALTIVYRGHEGIPADVERIFSFDMEWVAPTRQKTW